MDGQLDFLNLDEELEVAIPEDSKAYLKHLGLEEYKWDQFTAEDPGLYWQDVPLENNPEAYLDVLSRESQRRRSTKSVSSTSSAPDFSKAPSQSRKQRSSNRSETSRKRGHAKPGTIPQAHLQDSGDTDEQSKGLTKQVSFKERLAEEIPQDQTKEVTLPSAPKEHQREHRKSGRDKDHGNKAKQKERDRSSTRSSSKERGRSVSKDRHEKTKQPGKRKESMEREPQNVDRTDGSNSPRKPRRFKMPDLKNLLPGKKSDKQKTPVISAHDKNGTTIIGSDDDTDREGRGISCLSSGRHKHKYQEQQHLSSTTDVTSDESDFFRNSPNTVDLLTVCIDNQIPAHRAASQKADRSTNLKRTSSLLSAADGEKARSTHSRGQNQQKKDSPASSSTTSTQVSSNKAVGGENGHQLSTSLPQGLYSLSAPIVATSNTTARGGHTIETVSTDPSPGGVTMMLTGKPSPKNPPQEQLDGPLKDAWDGNLHKLKQQSVGLSNESVQTLRDEQGNTLLHLAAARGHLDCTEFLCKRWRHLLSAENKAKLTPAASAIKDGQIECLDWLLDNMNLDEEITSQKTTLLHWAAKFGQDGCLRLLLFRLDSRGHLNPSFVLDQHLNSPAHMAAKYGHLTCLQTLVEFGVDVCSANQYGHTPCYYADFGNHRHCAGYLMLVETTAHITRDLINSKHRQNRLEEHIETLNGHIKECMDLSGWWVAAHGQGEREAAQTAQVLEDLGEAASDLSVKLQEVLHDNQALRRRLNGPSNNLPAVTADVKESLEHTALLCEQLDSLNEPRDFQVTRQYILKVKDIQRKMDASSARFQTTSPQPHSQQEAVLLMRQRIQEATQRLVVYRTSRDGKTPRRIDPGLLSPDEGHQHGSVETIDTDVPQTKPHAARALFTSSEPNIPVKISASAMPLPNIPTSSSTTLNLSTDPAKQSQMEANYGESRTSNLFRPPVGTAAFRELNSWKSESQIQKKKEGIQEADPRLSGVKPPDSQRPPVSSFLSSFVSGRPVVQKSQTGSAFVPIVPNNSKLPDSNNTQNKSLPNQGSGGLRTMTSRTTGIHIHSALPSNTVPDQNETSMDSNNQPSVFDDPDKTPTPSPPPSRSYKSISSAISEVRRNIEEISKSRASLSNDVGGSEIREGLGDREVCETPMLSAVDDSSSNHSGDAEPQSARVQKSVTDDNLETKRELPGQQADQSELDFKRDFVNKEMRTSSPLAAGILEDQPATNVGRLTRENIRRNENLYWSTQKHDFTDNSFLETAQNKDAAITQTATTQNQTVTQQVNIFAGFAPAMPDRSRDTGQFPTRVSQRANGYERTLLGDFPEDHSHEEEEEDDFDPYGLEPYQGGTGLYFDHSLSTIEEVSVISESTKADDEDKDRPQNTKNSAKGSDGSTIVESEDSSARPENEVEGPSNKMTQNDEKTEAVEGSKAWYEDSEDEDAHPVAVTVDRWDAMGNSTLDLDLPPTHPPPLPPPSQQLVQRPNYSPPPQPPPSSRRPHRIGPHPPQTTTNPPHPPPSSMSFPSPYPDPDVSTHFTIF